MNMRGAISQFCCVRQTAQSSCIIPGKESMSVSFMFPGQGSQEQGMLHSLPKHPIVARALDEAASILEYDILKLDSGSALGSTAHVQMALLISGVAVSRLLESQGAHPDMVGGLSVGAFGAAVAAGVLPFDSALSAVRLRGELMDSAYPKGYGMAAIIGLSETQVADLVQKVCTPDSPLFVAGVNAPRQIVVSGSDAALKAISERAPLAGATKVLRLQVGVPSHCALLQEQAELLARAMAGIKLSPPTASYVDSRNGREVRSTKSIREDLATNMAHPVRWHDAAGVMYERGVRLFVELPPGRVLTALVAAAFPDARAVACAETRMDSVCALVRRESGRISKP
jgi:malonate decarboxylase epsilon subunit